MKAHKKLLSDKAQLVKWYHKNKRTFPWRENSRQENSRQENNKKSLQNTTLQAYAIWISEIMLQQTTVQTVIPYYHRFLKKFPNIEALAKAPLKEVIAYWSGLGYYKRAKSLHLSAQIIHKQKHFPRSYKELLALPGIGPYTARAISSLAFEETIGVLDTNVIRVLCRYFQFQKPWWQSHHKIFLQKKANEWVQSSLVYSSTKNPVSSSIVNQALMELGALICTSTKPQCLKCPLKTHCKAFKNKKTLKLPLQKTKKEKEIWLWKVYILKKAQKIAFIKHKSLPFLKDYLVFPGVARKQKTPPQNYHIQHSITHHRIYVQVHTTSALQSLNNSHQLTWLKLTDIKTFNQPTSRSYSTHQAMLKNNRLKSKLSSRLGLVPSSLIQKILKISQKSPS